MKIVGIGTDIVEISRIRNAKYIVRLAEYICTPVELQKLKESRNVPQYIASILAAKEAVIKAFPSALTYQDITVVRTQKGPQVRLATNEKNYGIHLSIAHEFTFAISNAMVCESI